MTRSPIPTDGRPPSVDGATQPPVTASDAGSALDPEMAGLCLLWSRDAPERVGEVVLLPQGEPGPWVFGRGEARGDGRRLSLARQVPGALLSTGPLVCPRVSRAQLRLSLAAGGGIAVENIGSCRLVRGAREVSSAELGPGDVVALKNEMLFLCVRRRWVAAPSSDELAVPPHPFGGPDAFGIVGESPPIWELRHRIVAIARQAFHVLVLGESGVGKELVAQAIHAFSPRGRNRMVSRNAATIPEGLAEAELFGNVRNYPNPGMPERPGLVGEANGSTLFLDEFAELPHRVQAHLLRVMDDGEYQRLGEAAARRADLRVVAATNRPPGDVKHDVLARLKVQIPVPDLNARREDVPLLAAHLLRRHAAEGGVARRFFPGGDPTATPLVSPVLIEALATHTYTAHVRELDAILVRAALEGSGRYLELGPALRRDLARREPAAPSADVEAFTPEERARLALLREHRFSPTACGRDPRYPGNRQTADLHLRQLLCKALPLAGWDARRAAEILAGPDAAQGLRDRCAARMSTFLANLRARVEEEAGPDLERALVEEWKGNAEGVLLVAGALREGRISGQ